MIIILIMTKQVFIFYVFFPKKTCALMWLSLKRCYVEIFANKDKNTGIIIVVKCNEEEEYPYIPFVDSIAIESTGLACYLPITRAIPYSKMEILSIMEKIFYKHIKYIKCVSKKKHCPINILNYLQFMIVIQQQKRSKS